MSKRWGLMVVLAAGLGLAWWLSRTQDSDENKEAPAYADSLPGYDTDVVQGALAVDFADDIAPSRIAEIGRRLGLDLRPASVQAERSRVYRLQVPAAREAEVIAALRADPEVEAAEEEFTYGLPEGEAAVADPTPGEGRRGFPDDPRYGEQWHMQQIHTDGAWTLGHGAGVIVAVIDTGVSRARDLQQTAFVPGWNFVDNNDRTDDDHGHGTHVAGTIAQSTNNGVGVAGVAWGARIMPIKVLSASGSGSTTGIADGIRWAADHGAKVINMSLGGRFSSQILAKAVKYAHDKGVVVVCAAGNDGQGKVSYPAAYPGAIAVAATQQDEKTAFYSNWGKAIDVAAPGGNTREGQAGGVLQNTVFGGKDDYYFFQGTSMASPHVAGVAALIVGRGVNRPDAVEQLLKDSARPPAGLGKKPADYAQRYGAGIIDARAALAKHASSGGVATGVAATLGGLLLLGLRRRGVAAGLGLGGWAGLVLAAGGLFFVPQWTGGQWPGAALLGQGLSGWDTVTLGSQGNPLFHSALIPVALGLLLAGTRLRGLVAGVALGMAGALLAQAFAGQVDVRFMPLDSLWLAANAAVAVLGAWLLARR